jgi:hypothetical protein
MKPFFAIVAHIKVVARYILHMTTKHYPRFIISTYICGTLIAVLLPHAVFATTIIAVIDVPHHRIILAADSLYLPYEVGKSKTGIGHRGTHCKIVVTPDCVSAIAGFREYGSLDLYTMLRDSCVTPGDLRKKADTFDTEVRTPVYEFSQWALHNAPNFFDMHIAPGLNIVQALFAGVQDKHLSVFGRGIFMNSGAIDARSFDQTDASPVISPYVLLGAMAIPDYINTHPDWNRGDMVAIVEHLMRLEISAHPDTVGSPVSIVEIGQSIMRPNDFTTSWIERGACQENAQNKNAKPN